MKEELLYLLKRDAYRRGEFTLSSGKKSEHYVNCKPVTLSGRGLYLTSLLLLDLIEPGSVAVAGLTLGADPLVSGVAMAASMDKTSLDALIVRKEAKSHGTQQWIEGPMPPAGSLITVLEDVVTTGGSAAKAVEKLRYVGYRVNRIVSIVDRQEMEADLTMYKSGLELYSLFTLDDLSA